MLPDFGSHDAIGHVTIRTAVGGFLFVPYWIDTNPVSCTVSEILSLKYFGVMTSSVTWP